MVSEGAEGITDGITRAGDIDELDDVDKDGKGDAGGIGDGDDDDDECDECDDFFPDDVDGDVPGIIAIDVCPIPMLLPPAPTLMLTLPLLLLLLLLTMSFEPRADAMDASMRATMCFA